MLLHYLTGFGILLAGTIHLSTVFLTAPVYENLQFTGGPFTVSNVYRNLLLASSLECLLLMVAFHGFNGLRVILIELYQGPKWERAVTWLTIVTAILAAIYGTRTIAIAYTLTG